MLIHPYNHFEGARQRHRELIREADRARAVADAAGDHEPASEGKYFSTRTRGHVSPAGT